MISRYASLRQGLVGAWCPSLGASGFRLIDRSGYGNHGTLTNMDPGTDWVASGGKGALDFDGVNDYVDLGVINAFNGVTKFSYSVWFRRASINAFAGIGNYTSNTARITFNAFSDGNLYVAVANGGNSYGVFASNDINWHNIITMYDGTQSTNDGRLKVYFDGLQKTLDFQGTTIPATTPTVASSFKIGFEDPRYSNASFDDIRIYNRALTPSEIQLLYVGGRGVGLAPERIKHRRKTTAAATNRRRRILCGANC